MTGVYAELLAASLGNEGVTAFLMNEAPNEATVFESPELPPSWHRKPLPEEREAFLR